MVEWLRLWSLRDMKCTVHDLEVMGSTKPVGSNLECVVLQSKFSLNHKYKLPIHLKSPHASKKV